MKITRFAQSCILIETKNKRILIDPGYINYKESYIQNEWKNIDIILITHKHTDHCHQEAILSLINTFNSKVYTSQEVQNTFPNIPSQTVKENDIINLEEIKIEVIKAIHGYTPVLKNRAEIYENIGYIIDDGENRLYQTSDTICFPNEYKCSILCVPVCNHGLVMGPFEAALFAVETQAKLVIPMHYDNPKYPTDLEKVKEEFDKQNLNYKILEIRESINI